MLRVVHVPLVAAWLVMNAMSSLSTDALTLTVGKNIYDPDPYPLQRFNTLSTNPRRSYLELIRGIRAMLTDDQLGPVFDIPRLADPNSVPSTRRFILVELFTSDEETGIITATITVALSTTTLYLVGYSQTNEFHYFPDTADGVDTLFPHLPHTELPFNSSYEQLENQGASRLNTPLGIASLMVAIDNLQAYRRPDLARSFLVIIQMFPEAIRYRYIDYFVGNLIRSVVDRPPDGTMIDLENAWGSLSRRIQRSVDGTINPPVVITDREGVPVVISTVNTGLALNIGILFFVCNRPPNANQLSLISTTPLHIDGGGTNCTNITQHITRLPIEIGAGYIDAADEDICENIESTVRIVGRNGLCADVNGGFYNGDPLILWPCKSNEDVEYQLWTLKADGTIRSKGKCITAYVSAPGNYIMIYDCDSVTNRTKWEIWDNGTIINPSSSLVLSAMSGDKGTELTVQKNVYATSQAWLVANNTQPTVTPIMNNDGDMCLEALDYVPQIFSSACQTGERRQLFAVYPDGTIRPDKTRDDCLTANLINLVVVTSGCNGGAEQRWSFNRDYTISNLDTGLVMDAQNDVISLFPVESRESQEWHAWFP